MTKDVGDSTGVSTPARTVVDAHCHSFNGADLPIEGFVRHVLLRDNRLPGWVKDRLARRADRMIQRGKHGYERERMALDDLLTAAPEGLATPEEGQNLEGPTFDEQVAQDLRALMTEDPDTAARLGAAPGSDASMIGPSDARAFLEFARNLASTRIDIARRLVATYPKVTVFTPLLVDMSYGVDDKPLTTVDEQIELHEKISRLSILGRLTRRDALLLPFVGFDPRREADSPGALEVIKDAIKVKGFAGVKLYPPMGFFPIRNSEPDVDRVLIELYDWCESECVPLTVHCNRTQGVKTKVNDKRSDPRRWGEVLEKHPALHLNLGHFGGINRDPNQPFWPEEVSRLARFGYVYADLGCHTDLLEEEGRRAYQLLLAELFEGPGGAMRDRLMYGSDWSMLLKHSGSEGYLDDVLSIFAKGEHERLLSGRARDFLGLGATPNKNGTRILKRITSLGADPLRWLAEPL